jgi:cell division protein FtsQ
VTRKPPLADTGPKSAQARATEAASGNAVSAAGAPDAGPRQSVGAQSVRAQSVRAQSVGAQSVGAQSVGAQSVPAQRRRHADPWRAGLFGVLILAIVAGAAWALLGSSLLVVRHVDVSGNRLVTAAQVRSAARIPVGQPLVRVNTEGAARRVEQIAAVQSAAVSRSWPNTIVIRVVERTPALAVAVAGGYDLVDEYGVIVRWAARQPPGLPLLTAPPSVLRGSPQVHAAALVLRQLPRTLRAKVISVSAPSATAVTLHLARGVAVLWGSPGQAAQKSAELALLLRTHAHFYDVSDPSTVVTQK